MRVTAFIFLFSLFTIAAQARADDLDVYLPREGTVAGGSNPAIYWAYDPAAHGYMVDLVGPNSGSGSCDGAVHFTGYIATDAAHCGIRRASELPYGDPMPAETILCLWYPGDLSPGSYALSVSPFSFARGWTGQDTLFRNQCASRYQSFVVEAPTAPPSPPTLQTPTQLLDCALYTRSVVSGRTGGCYPTITDVDGSTSWAQLWINDANQVNITNRWYPISALECKTELGIKRCSFPDISDHEYYGTASPWTWWVRAWNPAGASPWTPGRRFSVSPL